MNLYSAALTAQRCQRNKQSYDKTITVYQWP